MRDVKSNKMGLKAIWQIFRARGSDGRRAGIFFGVMRDVKLNRTGLKAIWQTFGARGSEGRRTSVAYQFGGLVMARGTFLGVMWDGKSNVMLLKAI
jgi:hypothetical protein